MSSACGHQSCGCSLSHSCVALSLCAQVALMPCCVGSVEAPGTVCRNADAGCLTPPIASATMPICLASAGLPKPAVPAHSSSDGVQMLLGSRSSVRVLNVARCPRLSIKALSFMVSSQLASWVIECHESEHAAAVLVSNGSGAQQREWRLTSAAPEL